MNLEIVIIAALVAASCALPGSFLVLRRMALMSDAISHSVLPGIVIGFFLAGSLDSPLPMLGAVLASMLTVVLTELLYRTKLVKTDAAIGMVFPAMFSVGVILVSLYAGNIHLDTDAVLLGELVFAPLDRMDVLGLSLPRSLVHMSVIFLLNLTLVVVFFKELKLSTFDPGLARSQGFRPGLLHYGLMLMVSITAIGAFDSVGSILVVAFMIAPAAAALLLTERLSLMLVISVAIGIASGIGGFFVAHSLDLSIAGSMATMTGVAFLVTYLFSPKRGMLTRILNTRRMKWEFALKMLAVHILHHEKSAEAGVECRPDHLIEHINWSESFASVVVEKAIHAQLIRIENSVMVLTGAGRIRAQQAMEH